MQIYLSLFVCIAGALVYALSDGKPSEMGRIAFFAGLLVFLAKWDYVSLIGR